MGLQAALGLIYPAQCLTCDAQVTADWGLCGACWRDTPFVAGTVCDKCGVPLPGEDDGHPVLCDDCLRIARPWARGRAAMVYDANARRMVLALKHGDRLDLARPAGAWLARAARPILTPGMLAVPVPIHRWRLLRRRFNQAAVLSAALARVAGLDHLPDALVRVRATATQDGRDRDARFRNVADAIRPHPRRGSRMAGRHVLIVDDVFTSGATLASAAEAARAAGAADVSVVTLARVAKGA